MVTSSSSTASPQKRKFDESHKQRTLPAVPKFLVVYRTDEGKDFSQVNPFVIQKGVDAIAGPVKSCSRLRNGTLLLETDSAFQAQKLLRTTLLHTFPVRVEAHRALNSSRGVVFSRSLDGLSEEDIQTYLSDQGVTAVHRVMKRVGQGLEPTRTVFLTFDRTDLPTKIKAGYEIISVRPYIPNPTRCYQCQRFNHTRQSCSHAAKCVTCGKDAHEGECPPPSPHCINCKGDHAASSRDCPVYKDERAIQEIRVKEKVSTSAARKLFASRKPAMLPAGKFSTVLASPRPTKEAATQTCDFAFSDTLLRSASPKIARSTSPLSPAHLRAATSSAPAKLQAPRTEARSFKKEHTREEFLRTPSSQQSEQSSSRRSSRKDKKKDSSPSPPRRAPSTAPPGSRHSRPTSVPPGHATASRSTGCLPAEVAAPTDPLRGAATASVESMEQDPLPTTVSSSAQSKSGPQRPPR